MAIDQNTPSASFVNNAEQTPIGRKAEVSEPIVSEPILPSSNFSVQLGAFNSTESTLKMMDELNLKGVYNTTILEETTNGKRYHKVLLQCFNSKSEAQSKLKTMKAKGIDRFVKKL